MRADELARGALVVALTALPLAACGSDEPPTTTSPTTAGASTSPAAPSPSVSSDPARLEGTRATITVQAGPDAPSKSYALVCDPPGGDHPTPTDACIAFRAAGADVFPPYPADEVCAQVYSGPETARVEGVVGGEPIDATFSRTDSCATSRWNLLAPAFPLDPVL